jgi:hypothetical protein
MKEELLEFDTRAEREEYLQYHKDIGNLYAWVIKSGVTQIGFRGMHELNTFSFSTYPLTGLNIPTTLDGLKAKALKFVEDIIPVKIHQHLQIVEGTMSAPFIDIFTCVKLWLGTNAIYDSVVASNRHSLPEDLLDYDAYEVIKNYHPENITGLHNGIEMTSNMQDAIPLFRDAKLAADREGLETIVLAFGLYGDDFNKWKDSKVQLTILCITLGMYGCYIFIHN